MLALALFLVLVFVVTSVAWAQTGIGQATGGVEGWLERNLVPLGSVLIAGAVGLSRLARVERDLISHKQETKEELGTRVSEERFDGYLALAMQRHTEVLNRLDNLHMSLRDVRRVQMGLRPLEPDGEGRS